MGALSVSWREKHTSPELSGNYLGEERRVRHFLVAWSDVEVFLQETFTGGILGFPRTYPGRPGLRAREYELVHLVDDATGTTSFSDPDVEIIQHSGEVQINVHYAPLESDPDDAEQMRDNSWVEYSRDDASEFTMVPGRAMKWESDDKLLPADITPLLFLPEVRHVLKWSRVINPPWTTFSAFKGKVNNAVYRLPGTQQYFGPETLLFESANDTGKIYANFNPSGPPTRTLTLTFLEKSQTALDSSALGAVGQTGVYGWNHRFREDTGQYDRLVNAERVGGNNPMFSLADLSQIFA